MNSYTKIEEMVLLGIAMVLMLGTWNFLFWLIDVEPVQKMPHEM
jgi:hypothetical protein